MIRQDVPKQPQAFKNDDKMEFKLKRIMWVLASGFVMGLIIFMTKGYTKFMNEKFYQKNSFRFCIIMFLVIVVISIYLILTTSKEGDRAQNMLREHPIGSYSMTGAAVLLLIYSFLFSTEIFGAIGIMFFIAFWAFFFNVILILPF